MSATKSDNKKEKLALNQEIKIPTTNFIRERDEECKVQKLYSNSTKFTQYIDKQHSYCQKNNNYGLRIAPDLNVKFKAFNSFFIRVFWNSIW